MKEKRVAMLEKYLSEDPGDVFSKYALALELVNINPERAQELFVELLQTHADYTPTYYHAAHFFWELGENEKAEEVFKKGIALLQAGKDQKALSELQNAYQNFLFDD